ncbi:MAG: chemotaxis protein CheB [Micavibrio sp.]|nr:chemotaxis protein CheB [Micavibrio sp.]
MERTITKAVVIGGSAGSLEALSALLPTLPGNYPLPIMVVVHIPPTKKSVMAELLKAKCQMDVREAEDKEPLKAGTIYFAPPDYHLLVEPDGRLSLSNEEPVQFSRPSIDVLFETAADAFGDTLVGIILSGANADGAKGMEAIVKEGGRALVQSPAKAYANAMPQATLDACPTAQSMDIEAMATYLQKVNAI